MRPKYEYFYAPYAQKDNVREKMMKGIKQRRDEYSKEQNEKQQRSKNEWNNFQAKVEYDKQLITLGGSNNKNIDELSPINAKSQLQVKTKVLVGSYSQI